VCLGCRLILELDGGHHGEPTQENYDARRDAWLGSQGFELLRFWNHQVMSEWDIVEDIIWNELQTIPLTPNPSPAAGRGEK
jgi:very-short-patch-repair endonuclease